MANTVNYASRFVPLIDKIYKRASFSSVLDTPEYKVQFTGVNEIKIFKTSTTGLGNYNRSTGYPKGDVVAEWESKKLTQERGKELTFDRMDNEETLGMLVGAVLNDYMRIHVIPELDAYRFAKYASGAGTTVSATLSSADDVINAIDKAVKVQNENEVPGEGRMLFVNSNLQDVLANSTGRFVNIGNGNSINNIIHEYNGIPITYVTPSRFYSQIEIKDGSSAYGYEKASSGKDINFLLMRKDAIIQVVKFEKPKIFSPDENQKNDSFLFQYRNYHDAFILDNKTKGIYVHTVA